jgi:hypothetical protein
VDEAARSLNVATRSHLSPSFEPKRNVSRRGVLCQRHLTAGQSLWRESMTMTEVPADDDVELAQQLMREWDEGRGISKSQLEIRTWGDATSHGRHFDRFVRRALGVTTNRPSKQTDRISLLEQQVRGLGGIPVGRDHEPWEVQLQHARESCLSALRIWNDPVAMFRTGGFSLLLVTAWNSLAIAVIQQGHGEWRKLNADGTIQVGRNGEEQSRETSDLVGQAFAGTERHGLRENVQFWMDLRNCVAHRYLPALDVSVIPYAQAGLLNFEGVLVDAFGAEYALADALTVPLQLSGFRDTGVLSSRKKLQLSLPLDVQAVLARAETASPELLADETFMIRVAFIPMVPASGRNPDAIAYFVRPGAVPTELAEALEQYVVLPKISMGARPNLSATHVIHEVERRTGYTFNSQLHVNAARHLNARPLQRAEECTVNLHYAEYITSFKRYLYSQAWIDYLVAEITTTEGFLAATGKDPRPI